MISSISVYPRTGGGNLLILTFRIRRTGLSPHGRGKRLIGSGFPGHWRSIPARAGETRGLRTAGSVGWVYPRTGGGNAVGVTGMGVGYGLSPHGRGKRPASHPHPRRTRSIPARAGETSKPSNPAPSLTVYPRTGGGNRTSPRHGTPATGLSPHGRGKRAVMAMLRLLLGSIPARAGETTPCCSAKSAPEVYPRTGGGNGGGDCSKIPPSGLSPHGRGKHRHPRRFPNRPRSIPARAGET